MSRFPRSVFVRQEGGAAVEFALVLPILLLILFGILEYGWYFTQQIVLINAVHQGARASSRLMRLDGESIDHYESRIRSAAADTVAGNYWFDAIGSVDVEVALDSRGVPEAVAVKVGRQPFQPMTGYLPGALVPSRLAARSKMYLP